MGNQRGKDVPGLEDARVIGKEAEHEAHQKPLQVVPFIAGFLEGVMELAHHFRGRDVHRVLIAERAFLDAENKGEVLYVLGELAEPEADRGIVFEVVQLKGLEVAHEDVARKFVLFESGKIVEGLLLGTSKVPARALLLHEQHTLPKQVDEAALVAEPIDRLLEAGDAAAGDAEHLEEFVVKGLALTPLVAGVLPFFGKTRGVCFDLVPAKAHSLSSS